MREYMKNNEGIRFLNSRIWTLMRGCILKEPMIPPSGMLTPQSLTLYHLNAHLADKRVQQTFATCP